MQNTALIGIECVNVSDECGLLGGFDLNVENKAGT